MLSVLSLVRSASISSSGCAERVRVSVWAMSAALGARRGMAIRGTPRRAQLRQVNVALFRWPTGLADGLALKEQRYGFMPIRPLEPGDGLHRFPRSQ